MFLVRSYKHKYFVFDTPCGVSGKLRSFVGFIRIYRLYKPYRPDRNNIVLLLRALIFFRNVRYEPQIMSDKNLPGM